MTDDLVTAVRELPNVEYAEAPFDEDDTKQTLVVTLTDGRTVAVELSATADDVDPIEFVKGLA